MCKLCGVCLTTRRLSALDDAGGTADRQCRSTRPLSGLATVCGGTEAGVRPRTLRPGGRVSACQAPKTRTVPGDRTPSSLEPVHPVLLDDDVAKTQVRSQEAVRFTAAEDVGIGRTCGLKHEDQARGAQTICAVYSSLSCRSCSRAVPVFRPRIDPPHPCKARHRQRRSPTAMRLPAGLHNRPIRAAPVLNRRSGGSWPNLSSASNAGNFFDRCVHMQRLDDHGTRTASGTRGMANSG